MRVPARIRALIVVRFSTRIPCLRVATRRSWQNASSHGFTISAGDGRAKRGANDRSDYVHERAFHVFEKDKSADKQKRDNDGTDGHHDKVRAVLTKQCPAKPLDDSSHRVQAVDEPPIFGHK